jgi:O-antigen ligase
MNKYLIIVTLLISSFAAYALLVATNAAYLISEHPVLSLFMRIVFFIIFVFLCLLRKKELWVYTLILGFPFYRIAFSGISTVLIFSLIVASLYMKEIKDYLSEHKSAYKLPIVILVISFLYSFIISKHLMTALEQVQYVINLILLYLIFMSFLISWQRVRILLLLLLTVNVLGIGVTIWQYIFGVNSIRFFVGEYAPNVVYDSANRIPSFFFEAQSAGIFFAVMIILNLSFLSMKFKFKQGIIFLIFLNIVALLLAGTRIAFIAVVIGLILFIIFNLSFKKILIIINLCLVLAVCGGFIYKYLLPEQAKSRINKQEVIESYLERNKIWITSLPIARHYPLGVGLSREDLFYAALKEGSYLQSKYFIEPSLRSRMGFESSFLDILYSLGFLGLFGFLTLLWRFFIIAFRNFRARVQSDESKLSLYLICAMVVWLIGAATSEKIYEIQPTTIFIIMIALAHSIYRRLYSEKILMKQ